MLVKRFEVKVEWTPIPVPCGFCGKPDEGYAKQDLNGKWKPSCWSCVKPKKASPPPKKKPVEVAPMEDLDLDSIIAPKKFNFEIPRMTKELPARKVRSRIEETTNDRSTDSTVHTRGTELVADKPATVRRRKVGTDGERR